MFNLSPERLLVIAVVAIILLGPDKLPQVAKQAGAAWRALTEFRHRMESEVRSNLPDLPSTTEIARLARSPSALLDHLSSMSEDDVAEGDAAVGEDQGPAPITGPGEVVSGNGPVPDGAGTDGAGTDGAGSNGTGSNEMWSNGAGSDGAGSNGAGSNGAGSNGSGAPVSVEGAAEEPERRSPPVAPPPRRRGSAANEPIVSGDPTLN